MSDETTDTGTAEAETESNEGARDEWAPPKSQDELDRIIEKRLARERAKFADIQAKADAHDALLAELESEQDQRVREARETARQEALREATPRAVRAEFKAAAAEAGVGKDQLAALLEDLDLSRYVTDDGDVDEGRIAAKVAAFAPAKPAARTGPSPSGLGNRTPSTARPGDPARAWLAKQGIKLND